MNDAKVGTLPFTRTVAPLGLSALLGATVLTTSYFGQNELYGVMFFTPIVFCYCCVAVVVLVLPVFAIWPRMRQPSLPLATVWGVVVACLAASALVPKITSPVVLIGYGSAGALSGLLYSYLAQRRT